MTTKVIVKPANFPAKVRIVDEYSNKEHYNYSESVEYVKAGEERTYYCTTTRSISVIDVEYDKVEGSRNEATGFKDD